MDILPIRDMLIALILFVNPTNEHYVGRQAALLMDGNPGVRIALKSIAVNEGYMYGYQANLFDDGFGGSCRALEILRELRVRRIEAQFVANSIKRNK